MYDTEREDCSPISKHYEFISKKKIMQNNKIIKFYRILFGLQITIILAYNIFYYAFSDLIKNIVK